jgi:hypothetical protein
MCVFVVYFVRRSPPHWSYFIIAEVTLNINTTIPIIVYDISMY